MSTSPTLRDQGASFVPQYIQTNELAAFGLPTPDTNPNIVMIVQMASGMIDNECGAVDGDGNGSLVYTTYKERILIQGAITSQCLLPMKPLSYVSQTKITALQAADAAASGGFYTGCLPNTITKPDGTLSPLIACSGRFVPNKRNIYNASYTQNALMSPWETYGIFGGPPIWIGIDVSQADDNPLSGEIWLPSSLYVYKYSEILVTYNAGFDPTNLPRRLKLACAALTKNLLGMGGITGVQSFSGAGISTRFSPYAIDPNIQDLLKGFYRVRAY